MTDDVARLPVEPDADLVTRRLRLDLEDLRFENARLKASVAERQAEIEALSNRLGALHAQRTRPMRAVLRILKLARSALRRTLRRRR